MEPERGDSSGRRLHRWRAQRLSEAGRLARVVADLLRRAEFEAPDFDRLIERVSDAERGALESAHGRIEPRKRFRGDGFSQPLRGRRGRNYLFLDEAGQSMPSGQSFFALAGIAMTPDAVSRYEAAGARLKTDFGIAPDKPFHEPDMRYREGAWGFGGDNAKQAAFDKAVARLLGEAEFTAFGVGIRKAAFETFVTAKTDLYLPTDVYSVAIQLLLERYLDFVAMTEATRPMGRLIFESQGALEDAYHARDYVATLIDGTQWIAGGTFRQFLETSPRFIPKSPGGMEIADMLARDLYEWIRDDCRTTPMRWDLFSERIYCRGDRRMGLFGVKIFPDSDIRDRIDAHRARSGPPGPQLPTPE